MADRSTIMDEFLGALEYPTDKSHVLISAREWMVSGDVMSALEDLPNRVYDNAAQLSEAVRGTES